MSANIRSHNSTVPEHLKKALKMAGITQAELAEAVGMQRQAITDIMSGRRIIHACEIISFARALGVTPNHLFGINDSEIRVVKVEDSEVIASIYGTVAICLEGYRAEIVNENDDGVLT